MSVSDSVNKLILGTVQFGLDYGINNPKGRPSEEEVFAILRTACYNGIQWLDTASAYGDAEERIGAFIKQTSVVNFKIISKFHIAEGVSPADSLERSLSRMNLPDIDTYLYHAFKDITEYPESLQHLEKLREQDCISRIGVSVYTNPELKAAIEIPQIDVIQLPFNLLDNEVQRGELLMEAKKRDKVIHTRSAFLQGLFFKPVDALGEQFTPLIPALSELDEIRQKAGLSWAELCLGYACSKAYIDGVLIGVDSVEQLQENLDALKNPLSEAVIRKIDEIRVEEKELLNPVNWNK